MQTTYGRTENMATEAVVDSSIVVALVTPEERSEWADKGVRKYKRLYTPDLAYCEAANAILSKFKEKKISKEQAADAIRDAVDFINKEEILPISDIIDAAYKIAADNGITTYDSAYMALADKLGANFITLDGKLTRRLSGTAYHRLFDSPE